MLDTIFINAKVVLKKLYIGIIFTIGCRSRGLMLCDGASLK